MPERDAGEELDNVHGAGSSQAAETASIDQEARRRRRANITFTSHTPVFCLAPVRSSSPRSAMGPSPEEACDPKKRLREPESCGEGVRSRGQAAVGNRLSSAGVHLPGSGELAERGTRGRQRDCACAPLPSVRRAGADKLPGPAAVSRGAWLR